MNTKLRMLLYCVLGGAPLLLIAMGAGHWAEWWLAGIVLAVAFVPVALYGPRRGWGQFGAVAAALLIITALCTWSEALLFVNSPQIQQHPWQALIGSCVLYLAVAAVLAVLAKALRLTGQSAAVPEHRSWAGVALLVPLCGIAYVLYYAVFGALTFQFFTHSYYPEATKMVSRLGGWFWGIQFARGVLMTLAVLPILYTLRMPRRQTVLVMGAVIWIAGGLAPLLMPNAFLSPDQRLIHIVEIFTQNFSLGVTAALLLRPREKALASSGKPQAAAAGH